MKKFISGFIALFFADQVLAQQLYSDFEGTSVVTVAFTSGVIDTNALNPASDAVNTSSMCAKYVRDTAMYDNIKFVTDQKMADIASTYAANSWGALKMKMKIYSTAPIGSYIYLQLGSKNNDNYPAGLHSEYIGITTKQNSWEVITFHFMQTPSGSTISSGDCDKLVVLFNPGSNVKDTFYIDDIQGPQLVPVGIGQAELLPFRLFQNSPNPAKENTSINFQLNSNSSVSLKLYDLLGNPVYTLVDQHMKAGLHSIQLDVRNLPGGIYFYIFKADGVTRTRKLIVDK